jgi:hypothetical protein
LRDVRTRWDSEYWIDFVNYTRYISLHFDSDCWQTISNITGSRLLPRSPE